ncbi:MAG: hypothetical protein WB992_04780, partial [Bryobacteraceae bacterium]
MNDLDRYLRFGRRKVPGWLTADSAEVIVALAAIQHELGYRGAVGEIGVYHGKLFILLLLTAAVDECGFAIDVFEKQNLSADQYHGCTMQMFQDNVRRWTSA